MENNDSIASGDRHLLKPFFWDVDIDRLHIKQHGNFIIERLLKFGRPEQVRWVLTHYPADAIIAAVKKSKNIDRKTALYWALHYKIDRKKIVCLNRQLTDPSFYC